MLCSSSHSCLWWSVSHSLHLCFQPPPWLCLVPGSLQRSPSPSMSSNQQPTGTPSRQTPMLPAHPVGRLSPHKDPEARVLCDLTASSPRSSTPAAAPCFPRTHRPHLPLLLLHLSLHPECPEGSSHHSIPTKTHLPSRQGSLHLPPTPPVLSQRPFCSHHRLLSCPSVFPATVSPRKARVLSVLFIPACSASRTGCTRRLQTRWPRMTVNPRQACPRFHPIQCSPPGTAMTALLSESLRGHLLIYRNFRNPTSSPLTALQDRLLVLNTQRVGSSL